MIFQKFFIKVFFQLNAIDTLILKAYYDEQETSLKCTFVNYK